MNWTASCQANKPGSEGQRSRFPHMWKLDLTDARKYIYDRTHTEHDCNGGSVRGLEGGGRGKENAE
jgi:hypothetical protein